MWGQPPLGLPRVPSLVRVETEQDPRTFLAHISLPGLINGKGCGHARYHHGYMLLNCSCHHPRSQFTSQGPAHNCSKCA